MTQKNESFLEKPTRAADIYIFAWHGVSDEMAADHRDIEQWKFFVASANELPPQRKITLAEIETRYKKLTHKELRKAVEEAVSRSASQLA